MRVPLQFETLDPANPDGRALLVAQLILNVMGAAHGDEFGGPAGYLSYNARGTHAVMYELSGANEGLVAAATVSHRSQHGVTFIHEMVVRPDMQGRGHGKSVLRHIAEQAIFQGDSLIAFNTDTPEMFSKRPGFEHDEGGLWDIVVDPEVIRASL